MAKQKPRSKGKRPQSAAPAQKAQTKAHLGGNPTQEPAADGGWWSRHAEPLTRDLIVALVAGALLFAIAVFFDGRFADRQERQAEDLAEAAAEHAEALAAAAERSENARYVRDSASTPDSIRDFQELDLRGALLSGLRMECHSDQAENCAKFDNADLREARMLGIQILNGSFTQTNLAGASLAGATLRGTSFLDADLTGAYLVEADLSRADLRKADMTDANLEYATLGEICWDSETKWPSGIVPPKTRRDCPLIVQGCSVSGC